MDTMIMVSAWRMSGGFLTFAQRMKGIYVCSCLVDITEKKLK